MAKFCVNCGLTLKPNQRFCPNCGTAVYGVLDGTTASTPDNDGVATNGLSDGVSESAKTLPVWGKAPLPYDPLKRTQQAEEQNIHAEKNKKENLKPADEEQKNNPSHTDASPGQSESKTGKNEREIYIPDNDIKSMFLRHDNRLNRKRYILRSITVAVAIIVVAIILSVIANKLGSTGAAVLGILISAAPIVPAFMLSIRRLHDLNRPAWWCIGFFIPMVNFVLGIYLLFFRGTNGPNQYGPDPLSGK